MTFKHNNKINTCDIDASKIEPKITSKTKAIMPLSLCGQFADMDEINAVVLGDIDLVNLHPDRSTVYAQYTVLVSTRYEMHKHLSEASTPTVLYHPVPFNEQPACKKLCSPDCVPVAQKIAKRVMTLPISPDFSSRDSIKIVRECIS